MKMNTDYFAELYIAGLFADRGWNIYFPHRDKGFDFIISKTINGKEIIRPIQVKGKYPSKIKKDHAVYGYVGSLSKLHTNMIMVIPFFNALRNDGTDLIAFMPYETIKQSGKGNYKCQPAQYKNGKTKPRRDFEKYFNENGLDLMERESMK